MFHDSYMTCLYFSQNYKGDIPYPHNVLRNAARKGAATEFVFLIDVDVMPSLHMREGFNEFANRYKHGSHNFAQVLII